jgi:hypothetical protein
MPSKMNALDRLDAIDERAGCVDVIVETPRDSRDKYKYEPERRRSPRGALKLVKDGIAAFRD